MTPDTGGGPRIVADEAAALALPVGTLLRDSEGRAYRIPPWRPEWLRSAVAFFVVLEVDGDHHGLASVARPGVPYPLFVVWTPDAEPTTTTEEISHV